MPCTAKLLRSYSLALLLLCIVPGLSSPAGAAGDAAPEAAQVAQRLDAYFQALTAIDRFNGVVLWAEGEEVHLLQAYQLADLPDAGRIDVNSAFHVASIRKLFSHWLLHDAAARGMLSMDDPVARHFPDFPRGEEITIQQLLDHQSGLPRGERFQFEARHYPLDDYLELIASQPLEFEPGTQTLYSNFGYLLIDLILQSTTGEHPADLMAKRLFDPAGMIDSFEYHRRPTSATVARGLFEQEGQLEPVEDLDMAQFETGNVFSSASDLLNFVQHPGIRAALSSDGSIAHAGGKRGYRSWLHHDTRTDRTLVILSNLSATPIQRVIDETGAILAGETVALPAPIKREQVEVDRQVLARYVGRYRIIANGQQLAVRLEDDGLVIYEVTEEGLSDPQKIFPESENRFFTASDSSDTIHFELAEGRAEPRMRLTIMGGYELETEKLE